MKNLSLLLLFSLIAIIFPSNVLAANEDFCEKFPLNSRCREESSNTETKPLSDNINPEDKELVEDLTPEQVEQYIKELGYIDVKRNPENDSLTFLMQGRLCLVIIVPNGKGMSISTYYPKEEKTTLEVLNDWNRGLRYSFAYVYTTKDDKEFVLLETNLTVTGGVTKERIKTFFMHHSLYQTRFEQFITQL